MRATAEAGSRRRRSTGTGTLSTAGQFMAGYLLTGASSLLVNVLAARMMGPEGRGSLALFLQLTYLTNVIAVAGIDRSFPATVAVPPTPADAARAVARLLVPSTALVLLAVAPVTFLLGGAGSTGLLTAAGYALTVIALLGTAGTRISTAAAGGGPAYLVATVAGQSALIVTAVVLVLGGARAPALWLVGYGVALGAGPLAAWLALRRTPATDGGWAGGLSGARRLGLRVLPATVASMIMLRADRLLLPWLGSYSELGLYIIVATVTELALWPVQSVVDAQTPRWHRQFLAGTLRRRPPLLMAAGYGVVAAVGLLVLGRMLLVPVFGAAYRESLPLILPLAVGAACYGISRVAVGLSLACGRARAVLLADIPAMVVALACFAALIPGQGAMGAAVGSAAGYGVSALLASLLCLWIPEPPPGPAGLATPAGEPTVSRVPVGPRVPEGAARQSAEETG